MTLVTGAAGFIGSHLVEALLARGEPVRVLIRPTSSRCFLPRSEIVLGDLATGAGVAEALNGIDTVFHVAGVTKALRPEEYHRGNVQASRNLARAAAGKPLQFVHVSSLAAIGPSTGAPVTEDAEPHPVTRYGQSKLEAEEAVRALKPDAVIVRPPVVYGPRDTGVLQVLKPLSRGWALEIAGGDRWFSAIYVKDLVEGLLAVASCPAAAGRAYFLSHREPVSWKDLTVAAGRVIGRQPHALRVPKAAAFAVAVLAETWSRLAGRPGILSRDKVQEALCPAWTCDCQRASNELGFEARTPLQAGIAETLAWYKEAGWLSY